MTLVTPTRRGRVAILLGLAAFAVLVVNHRPLLAAITAAIWAVISVSLVTALTSLRRLQVRREEGEGVRAGQRLTLPIVVRNNSRWRRAPMLVQEQLPFLEQPRHEVVVPSLAAHGGECRLPRAVFAARRGEYRLDGLCLRSGDPAGLFKCERTWSLPTTMLILPKCEPLNHLPMRLHGRVVPAVIGRAIGVSGVGQEFFGVREYRPTDGMRFIHWKASARQQQLMVREFEENNVHQVNLLLETDRRYAAAGAENFEYQVSLAASVVAHLAGLYCHLSFGTAAHFVRGPSQTVADEIMHHLAFVQPDEQSCLDLLDAHLERILPGSILYCLTMSDAPELKRLLDALLDRGVDIRWLQAPAAGFDRRRRRRQPATDSSGAVKPLICDAETAIPRVLSHG